MKCSKRCVFSCDTQTTFIHTYNERATAPSVQILFTVKTYNFDVVLHVLHLVALGYIFQQCPGDLPHLLVIRILQLSTLHKCDKQSRKLR